MANKYSAFNNHTVIIIGGGDTGYKLHNFFRNNPDRGYSSLGVFDDRPENVKDIKSYLGGTDVSINYAVTFGAKEIFCTLPGTALKKIEQLMLEADKNLIRFRLVPEFNPIEKKVPSIQYFGNIPVISIRPDPLESRFNRFIKRVFDIVFSLCVIIFLFSWLLPILAILIKLESKGPVFFVQQRSGLNNRTFKCYKLRSMRVNDQADKKQATRDDERITKIGAWLRRTSLDELPQFFNALIGNMSVVGPRPHMLCHTREYSELIDQFMVRHFLSPGITGWAQIKGLRGETKTTSAMLKRVEADVWYLENWSFLLDLKIVFLTVWNYFKKDENAF
jgi:putative colanic acid biosynthesis UDP-glucose lipid carrier transferase